jgi:hypothetical protein
LNRRAFLFSAAALAAQSAVPQLHGDMATSAIVELKFGKQKPRLVPEDFTGLSYESPQLYNPEYFCARNTSLVAAYRRLGNRGILRIGGNLSDVSMWRSENGDFRTPKQDAAVEHGKSYWEWKLTDPSVRDRRDGAITPVALAELRGFLDATGWQLLYGLNFGSGSAERAADEALHVVRALGPRLLAFQLGNEADFWASNRFYRDHSYNFEEYMQGWDEFATAIRRVCPDAPFAGPDVATNLTWLREYGARKGKESVLLTSHFYAMGPAKDPAMDAGRLLGPSAGMEQQIAAVEEAGRLSGGTPFRMAEGNSCYGGGKPGVSNTCASALWGADYMLRLASAGYAGINLHGGGDGFYTPIAVAGDGHSTELRPLFFGMLVCTEMLGYSLVQGTFSTGVNATAYLGHRNGITKLAIINKGPDAFRLHLTSPAPRSTMDEVWALQGASLDAVAGVTFSRAADVRGHAVEIPPYSGMMLCWKP